MVVKLLLPAQLPAQPPTFLMAKWDCEQIVRDGQLVLMDAGCELHGYGSDITRTWPVSGYFTPPQRDVYDIVLEVHR